MMSMRIKLGILTSILILLLASTIAGISLNNLLTNRLGWISNLLSAGLAFAIVSIGVRILTPTMIETAERLDLAEARLRHVIACLTLITAWLIYLFFLYNHFPSLSIGFAEVIFIVLPLLLGISILEHQLGNKKQTHSTS